MYTAFKVRQGAILAKSKFKIKPIRVAEATYIGYSAIALPKINQFCGITPATKITKPIYVFTVPGIHLSDGTRWRSRPTSAISAYSIPAFPIICVAMKAIMSSIIPDIFPPFR